MLVNVSVLSVDLIFFLPQEKSEIVFERYITVFGNVGNSFKTNSNTEGAHELDLWAGFFLWSAHLYLFS